MDQAEELRRMVQSRAKLARVLAITSGKGGVGKSNVAVNLAIASAALGKRVILIDMDLGLANADVILNVNSRYNLSHVVAGKKSLEETLVRAPGNVILAPGASGIGRLADLTDSERANLLKGIEHLQRRADLLIVDTGAGISKNVTGFLACADEVLVVTTPEPTAIVDAYAVIKTIAHEEDHGDIRLVVNMVTNAKEGQTCAANLVAVARRFLNAYIEYAGCVVQDARVSQAVKRRRPFLLEYPTCEASRCVRELAQRLVKQNARVPAVEVSERPSFLARLAGLFRTDMAVTGDL
ncbi:MAG: MinD/ParA family protein [Planctomycetes bacterium]|nr:MinD/ParA family protein [Planctomycetota bacterium]